jgi:hypothetical protein
MLIHYMYHTTKKKRDKFKFMQTQCQHAGVVLLLINEMSKFNRNQANFCCVFEAPPSPRDRTLSKIILLLSPSRLNFPTDIKVSTFFNYNKQAHLSKLHDNY